MDVNKWWPISCSLNFPDDIDCHLISWHQSPLNIGMQLHDVCLMLTLCDVWDDQTISRSSQWSCDASKHILPVCAGLSECDTSICDRIKTEFRMESHQTITNHYLLTSVGGLRAYGCRFMWNEWIELGIIWIFIKQRQTSQVDAQFGV